MIFVSLPPKVGRVRSSSSTPFKGSFIVGSVSACVGVFNLEREDPPDTKLK